MVSEFRKKKLLHMFNNFFDCDNNGTVDKKDFELAAANVSKHRGWEQGHPKQKETFECLMNVWEGLQSAADADGDGQVTPDEWISMWDTYLKDPSAVFDWQKQYCKYVFDMEDASGDGSIDCEEFTSVSVSFGIDREEAVASFKKMSKGKSSVSWPEFQELWREFFASDDPEAPGNCIFGKSSF